MDNIIDSTGDIELAPARIPRNTGKCVWNLEHLLFNRKLPTNVIDKNIFIGLRRNCLALEVVVAVVSAGKNQQRVSIRTYNGGNRMIHRELRQVRQIRIQWLEDGAFGSSGRNHHA